MPPASAGSHGSNGLVAYYAHGSEYDTGCEFEFVTLSRENAEAAGGTVKTLVGLTDEERGAIERLCEAVTEYSDIDRSENGCHADDDMAAVAVARGILKRTQPVGPAPVERLGGTKVTDVDGAGPT
jgi:hypothetical protein